MLSFTLPCLLGFGYLGLLDHMFIKQPRNRVDKIIEEYIHERLDWHDCPDFVKLCTRGLPHGSSCTIRLDLNTGRFCLVERAHLPSLLLEPEKYRLAEAATISNEVIPETSLLELLELLKNVPPAGELKLEWTVHDGLSFDLEVVRNDQKRSCRGNLVGLPKSSEGIPELPVIRKLRTMSDTWQPNHQGIASCDAKGNITIYP